MTAPDDVRAKLLPCPFCGHSMESDDEDGCYQKAGFIGPRTPVWSVTCFGTACNASVEATSKDAAIAAWNRRAAHADLSGDPRSESGNAEEVAQWLYANRFREAAATVRNQLDVRNQRIADLSGEVRELVEALKSVARAACPASTDIDTRGYSWSEAYLDQALPLIRSALAKFTQEKP